MSTTMEGALLAQETAVLAKAHRRRFTAAEKLRVLREADRCVARQHSFPVRRHPVLRTALPTTT